MSREPRLHDEYKLPSGAHAKVVQLIRSQGCVMRYCYPGGVFRGAKEGDFTCTIDWLTMYSTLQRIA